MTRLSQTVCAGSLVLFAAVANAQLLGPKATDSPPPAAGSGAAVSAVQPATPDTTKVLLAHREAGAAKATAEEILALLSAVKEEQRLWREQVEPLRTNDDGKRIAANPEYVRRWRSASKIEQVTRQDLDAIERRVKSDIRLIDTVLEDAGAQAFPGKVTIDLDGEKKTVAAWRARYQNAREAVEAILADAKRTSFVSLLLPPSAFAADEKTLDDAVKDQETEEIEKFKEGLREPGLSESQLKKMAADPEVKAWYKPFLEKGKYNGRRVTGKRWMCELGQNGCWEFPRPISYSILASQSVFSGDQKGWQAFANIACSGRNYPNDRTVWERPKSEEALKRMSERYRLFIKLAPIWKESGDLAP